MLSTICMCSPFLEEVVLASTCPNRTDKCLAGLLTAPNLRALELRPKSFTPNCDHMYLIGMMNLCELRLDSHSFQQQCLTRAGLSHIDNEGVRALVDSICARSLTQKGKCCLTLINVVSECKRLSTRGCLQSFWEVKILTVHKLAVLKAGRKYKEKRSWWAPIRPCSLLLEY